MQSFMVTLLTCSVTMSVLALFYMALTPLLAKHYSEKGRYYAWLIVVIGLIIPFRPQFNNAFVKVDVPGETAMPIIQIGNGMPVPVGNAALSPALPSVSWWQIAAAVWLTGVVVFLTYHIIKHYCFVKMVTRWSENITDEHSVTLLQSLKSEMGISKQISLCRCSSIGSPMMIGFVNTRILLPKADLAHDELRFILKHELVHHKRKDLYYKCLVLIATAIHWFNPIVYLMAQAIDALCEISCDTEVVQNTDADTRQHYSETIIGVVKYQSRLKTALSTNFYGGKKGMKNRISSIMDTGKKKAGAVIICVALIATMGTGFAFAANGNPQSQPAQLEANEVSNESRVAFHDLDAIWDTGWGDDEFFLKFAMDSDSTISEYGIKCWDSNGVEIKYIDGPYSHHDNTYYNGYGFCIGAIDTDGSHIGSLVPGETYNWIVYVVVGGERYESQTNSFIFSTQGTRFGQ